MKFKKPSTSTITAIWGIIYFLFGIILPGRGIDTEESIVTYVSFILFVCFGVKAFVESRKKKK